LTLTLTVVRLCGPIRSGVGCAMMRSRGLRGARVRWTLRTLTSRSLTTVSCRDPSSAKKLKVLETTLTPFVMAWLASTTRTSRVRHAPGRVRHRLDSSWSVAADQIDW
jgi:hypothetical protein